MTSATLAEQATSAPPPSNQAPRRLGALVWALPPLVVIAVIAVYPVSYTHLRAHET